MRRQSSLSLIRCGQCHDTGAFPRLAEFQQVARPARSTIEKWPRALTPIGQPPPPPPPRHRRRFAGESAKRPTNTTHRTRRRRRRRRRDATTDRGSSASSCRVQQRSNEARFLNEALRPTFNQSPNDRRRKRRAAAAAAAAAADRSEPGGNQNRNPADPTTDQGPRRSTQPVSSKGAPGPPQRPSLANHRRNRNHALAVEHGQQSNRSNRYHSINKGITFLF